jgi:iron complex outermembrane receptor protein
LNSPSSAQTICDLSGQPLYNAPRWTVNSSAEYVHPVNDRWNGFVLVDGSYKSLIYFQQNLNPITSQGGYSVFDARVGGTSNNGLKIEAFATNLFNKDYVTLSFPTAFGTDVYAGYLGAPRTFGMRIAKTFQ